MTMREPGSRRTRLALAAVAAGLLLAAALAELLPLVPGPPPPPPDYGKDAAWLCRPGRDDVCSTPTTATVFAPDGGKRIATTAPDPAALIDCFYVYPTVSRAPGDNAPIAATEDETAAARNQLARFSSVCRTYAPLYRQVTRNGLRKVIDNPDPELLPRRPAYADVLAAWRRYLAEDNHGRGFVLIGHSQGANILSRLIAAEIDGTPLQARLVAAIIPGTAVDVPVGARTGGTFAHIPTCAGADQPGCVIAYSTFPADRDVPDNARFGGTKTPGMVYACVDPAAVAGTPTLDADLPLRGEARQKLGTDFTEFPGLLTSSCRMQGRFSILAIAAGRTDATGETASATIERLAEYSPAWGLHGLDLNLAEGTLVDIVRRQAAAYAKSQANGAYR